ncbi:hypothetical protein I6J39_34485 (plasmid) [Streptomyces californicus]|uniref:Uncharacterized protein n=1 Tax=Streptomyces californicus TaxID=67351 RepID=A0ABX7JFC8_9ACTN|nr:MULTISPECIES: hypothetical protein [Streptomyces]QRV32468.1 hypothetical protein I6J39_34485 [Streptomyces californicus]QRV45884.1 hypothetical protein I6J41_34410 [Streptomyces californicus]
MATKPVSRRRRKPAASTKPRAGRAKAPATPASIPAQTAAPEITVPAVYPEADPILADAADRAADLRDQAAADVARILAEGEARAADLLESAGIKAASITETANVEQSRILATAATDADRVRTEAATTAAADADQVRAHAEAKADQLLADARAAADTLTTTAGADADQLRADARHQAREVTTAATVHAEQVRTEAARTAAKTLAEAESARTELLAAAERTAVDTRTRAATDAEQLLEHARGEADRLRESAVAQAGQVTAGAEKAAAELREDAAREREASRADAARARTLATEDIGRLRATAGEDVDRMTRTARQEAERIVAAARSRVEAELKEAQETLARAKVREADAEVTLQAADDMAKEAGARMARAMDPTERRIERRRRKDGAREERREARAASRAGKPSRAEQAKRFLVVNAERLLVILPITAPMAVAWTGQAGFAEDILGWVAPWTILFAAAFELSTAFVGWMYHQSRKDGDAGTLYRIATWIFAMGAAVMNFWHASGMPKPGGTKVWDEASRRWVEEITYWHFTPKAVAFATMSLVGMALWELYATLLHRRSLRQDGKVAQARPTIGLVRWFRYPRHAFTAWSLAITDASLTTLNRSWYAAERELAFQKTMRSARRGSPLPATYRVLPLTGSPNPGQVPNFFVNLERTDGVNPHDGAANPNRRALPPGPDTNRVGTNQQSGKGEPSGGGGSRRTAGEPGPRPEANPAETNGEPAEDGTTNLRTRSQQQREQVQQVLNLFDELGFDNVKLQVVQDRTGMTKTTAYHRLKDARRDWEQRAAG